VVMGVVMGRASSAGEERRVLAMAALRHLDA